MKIKENKGISVIAFIIVIAVIVIIATCIIVYLINNPVKEKVAIQNPTTVTETNSSDKVEEKVVKTTMTANEKFEQYVKNLKNEMLKYNKEKVEGREYREYIVDGKDINGKKYSITLSGNGILEFNEKEVATNVIGFNVVYIGQDGSKSLYFIKDNGTVAYTSIDNPEYLKNGNVKTTDIKDLKNIISIIGGFTAVYEEPGGGGFAYAIDIEGNMFEIK